MSGDRVLVGMSGGVDSAVSALLLKQAGHEVVGVTFKLWAGEGSFWEESISDAKSICDRIGIEHLTHDLEMCFHHEVIGHFIDTYQKGSTPNPCVQCNRFIKFPKMIELADRLGIPYVATGHYARVMKMDDGRYALKKAIEEQKDQSYFLYSLDQPTLSRVRFPLGEYTKTQVREIAQLHGFVNAHKRDSQDICFVRGGDYASFIEGYTGQVMSEGVFLDSDGRVLGKHKGAIRYTVGQRKGLGIALGAPAFVLGKDMAKNTVTLGKDEQLFCDALCACESSFVSGAVPTEPFPAEVKIRNTQKQQSATVTPIDSTHFCVKFDTPQWAISKGQAVVLYHGDTVLGGGIIE